MPREIFPDLYLIRPDKPAPQTPFTYLLRRETGNVLFATKADVTPALKDIEALGGAAHILLGDRHHASPKLGALAKRLKAPVSCSTIEATVIRKKDIAIDRPLPFERQALGDDLEIIPTPGHTPGAFSYLWTHKKRRFLFIGDTLVPVDGEWRYWVTTANRAKMRATVAALAAVSFDVIISNSFASTPQAWIEMDPKARKAMFTRLQAELAA